MILQELLMSGICFNAAGSGGGGGGGGNKRPETKPPSNSPVRPPAHKDPVVGDGPTGPKPSGGDKGDGSTTGPVTGPKPSEPVGGSGGGNDQPVQAPETIDPEDGVGGSSGGGQREGGANASAKASRLREENATVAAARQGQDPYRRGGPNRRAAAKQSRGPNPLRIR